MELVSWEQLLIFSSNEAYGQILIALTNPLMGPRKLSFVNLPPFFALLGRSFYIPNGSQFLVSNQDQMSQNM